MRILLDQDEVLSKWTAKILEWYNEDHGTSFKVDDVKDTWMLEGLLGQEANHFIRSCMRWPEFYTILEPVEGAIYGVKKLMDAGHDVVIVTAVPVSAGIAYHGKCQWLRNHMPFFPLKNLVAVHRKELVYGDILLDDGPHNIKAFEASGRPGCIFETPGNKGAAATYRVKHWNEFLKLVEDLSSRKEKA